MGEQMAVVWKRLYRSPAPAMRSAVGMGTGPPNALDAPNPTSSSSTRSTLGACFGGRFTSIGSRLTSSFFSSTVIGPT